MKEPRIAGLLGPVVEQLGLDLEAVDVVPAGKRRLLRVVVDGDGDNGRGPTLDDIAAATKAVSVALDASSLDGAAPYTLEVSTRGVGRALELPRHWRRNATRLVAVTLTSGEQLTGRVVSATDTSVVVDVDGQSRELDYADVRTAVVQVELNRPATELEE